MHGFMGLPLQRTAVTNWSAGHRSPVGHQGKRFRGLTGLSCRTGISCRLRTGKQSVTKAGSLTVQKCYHILCLSLTAGIAG